MKLTRPNPFRIKKGIKRYKNRRDQQSQSLLTATSKIYFRNKMKESSSDINQNKAIKGTRIMRIEASRKSGMVLKGMTIGIKMIPTTTDMVITSHNTKETVTMEISKIASPVDLTTKATGTVTTLTSSEENTEENSRADTMVNHSKTADTMIEEEMNSIRITSLLRSLNTTKKDFRRSMS